MHIRFHKYQGTGNDFVMIDNRNGNLKLTTQEVSFLCSRRFGIGADGLILLENEDGYDFKMVYFNSDGRESSMCGNGGRCITQFAYDIGIIKEEYRFLAIDGLHLARRHENKDISLKMIDVANVQNQTKKGDLFLNTGSPHYVSFRKEVEAMNLVERAQEIRYSEQYKEEGVNVNFVEVQKPDCLMMRTYERGVEDETYSCGTGVTAAALGAHKEGLLDKNEATIKTKGGELSVSFKPKDMGYEEIWLTGAAKHVFEGEIQL